MIVIAPARVRDTMVPTIFSAGPTPTNLAVSAYRPPEVGYAAMVPDTFYNAYWDPANVPFDRLRTYNTGWETGAYSSQGNLIHENYINPNAPRNSGGFGIVETGVLRDQYDPEWCCGTFDFFCDAEECQQQDRQAAIDAAKNSGGGIIVGRDDQGEVTEPIAVVEVEENLFGRRAVVTGRNDPEFDRKLTDSGLKPQFSVKDKATSKSKRKAAEREARTEPSSFAPRVPVAQNFEMANPIRRPNAPILLAGLAAAAVALYFVTR